MRYVACDALLQPPRGSHVHARMRQEYLRPGRTAFNLVYTHVAHIAVSSCCAVFLAVDAAAAAVLDNHRARLLEYLGS